MPTSMSTPTPDSAQLAATLEQLDGRGYKAYRDIEGKWTFSEFTLFIDRVQADPFADPSKLRIRVPLEVAALPARTLGNRTRQVAAAAWLARAFRRSIREVGPRRAGTGKGGLVSIDAGGAEVLERTAVVFGENWVEARIEVGLPAAGRRALGGEAASLLTHDLREIATRAWIDRSDENDQSLLEFVDCVENQESIRGQLRERGFIAFVGDGAILPRESGASERPMLARDAAPFSSPQAFRVEFQVPHADAGAEGRVWRGMGIPRGIVLMVGGGYHGKSTVLRAIERAVVAHGPGDGRETVVADPALVKIRAEDGRAITGVDIQNFVDRLPPAPGRKTAKSTRHFSTSDASGSTSQAANIAEAIEVGASGLLLDEDTCATNFMVRDARMQALVHPRDEPITPFVDRVRALYDELGVSSLIVMGGSGDYFDVADAVIEMKAYQALDVTARAQAIVETDRHNTPRPAPMTPLRRPDARIPLRAGFDARRGRREVKISSRDNEEIVYGTTKIDLRGVEQLFDPSQTRAIASALHVMAIDGIDEIRSLDSVLDEIEHLFDQEGLDGLDPLRRKGRHPGALARPRRFEIAAALNRMRTLQIADAKA